MCDRYYWCDEHVSAYGGTVVIIYKLQVIQQYKKIYKKYY